MTRKTLQAFGIRQAHNGVNISGEFASWEMPTFPTTETPIHFVNVHMGDIGNSISVSQDIVERFRVVFSGLEDQHASTRALFALNSQKPLLDADVLKYPLDGLAEQVLSGGLPYIDNHTMNFTISSNALNRKDFDLLASSSLHIQTEFQKLVSDIFMGHAYHPDIVRSRILLPKDESIGFIESLIQDSEHLRLFSGNYRFIGSDRINRLNNEELMSSYEKSDETFVSIFPDAVMVHHDTTNIRNDWLWFSYEEFDKILYQANRWLNTHFTKKTLPHFIHKALRDRL